MKIHRTGEKIALLTYGPFLKNVMDGTAILSAHGIEASVLRLLSVATFPVDDILQAIPEGAPLIIVEEAASGSGIREALTSALQERRLECRVYGMDLGKRFIPHGNLNTLYSHFGLDGNSIAKFAREVLSK